MLMKLENPKAFSEIIGIISEMVLEVRMKIDKEGLSISAIDPANVAMILFKLPSDAFSELEVDKEEVLGVSLESLKAVLRRVKVGSVLIMTREENELKLEIRDKINREFNLALIDIESEDKPIPSLEFVSKIEMTSLDFSEAIEDCSVVADSCSFVSDANSFVIKAKGSLNSFKSQFTDEVNIQAEEATSKYSLEYLQKMIKGTKLTDKVVINFSNDYPLKLEFNTPKIELFFILAPRVESDDWMVFEDGAYYVPERDGNLNDYLKSHDGSFAFPLFKGIELYYQLWDEGFIQPNYSTIRLMWNIGREDEHFLIRDYKRLEGLQLPAHSGREGIFTPEEIFTSDAPCWEANRLKIRYE